MPSPGVTKSILADAMKHLMEEQPFSKISVGEIVAHCSLNRNSFYYHFQDKYELVNWIFYTEFAEEMQTAPTVNSWDSIEKMCQFFYRNKVFYTNALSVTGQNSFSEYFTELINSVLLIQADEWLEDTEDREYYALFFTDAFVSAISRWLREGAKIPPERLASLMRRALTQAAIRIVDQEATQQEKE